MSAGSLTISDGDYVSVSTGTVRVTGSGESLSVTGTGSFVCTGAANIQVTGVLRITTSNFVHGTSTVSQYSTNTTLYATDTLYNYTWGQGGAGSYTLTLASDLVVMNNLKITTRAGAVQKFNAGSYNIYVGDSIVKASADSFLFASATVHFIDTTVVGCIPQSIGTFGTLKCVVPGKTIEFTHGTTTTVTSFVAIGSAAHPIVLKSEDDANAWTLSDAEGTNRVYYCNISYSAAEGGAGWTASVDDGKIDGGNNTGWSFAALPVAGSENPLFMVGD
jgi:hypothetical protein